MQLFWRVSTVNKRSVDHGHNYLIVLLDHKALAYAEGLSEENKDDFDELVLAIWGRNADGGIQIRIEKQDLKGERSLAQHGAGY